MDKKVCKFSFSKHEELWSNTSLILQHGDQETMKVLFENKNFDAFYTQEVTIDKHKSMK
jgi:hypothetical protein